MSNPFTTGYQAVFNALTAHQPLLSLVQVPNLIDLTDPEFDHVKREVSPQDLPELCLFQSRWKRTWMNSRATGIDQSYPLRIATGDMKVLKLNDLKYQVLCAMEKKGDTLGDTTGLIRGWDISEAQDVIPPEGQNRGTERWTTVANVMVYMQVPKTTLTA